MFLVEIEGRKIVCFYSKLLVGLDQVFPNIPSPHIEIYQMTSDIFKIIYRTSLNRKNAY